MIKDVLEKWGLADASEEDQIHVLAVAVNDLERSRGGQLVFDMLQYSYDGATHVLHTCDLHDTVKLQEAVVRARASKEILDTLTGSLRAREYHMRWKAEEDDARKATAARKADGLPAAGGPKDDLGVDSMGIETRTQTEGGEIA